MQPDPLTNSLLREGKNWGFSLKHEWVDANPEALWEALQYSPLGISVVAWPKDGKYYVKSSRQRDNHWTLLVAGVKGKSWKIFDSYVDDDFFKEVKWDYPFGFVKWYQVEKLEESFIQELIRRLMCRQYVS